MKIINYFQTRVESLYFALDVLEHLSEPFHLIEKFETESNKGDILVISAPNFASVRMLLAWAKGFMPKEDIGYFDYSPALVSAKIILGDKKLYFQVLHLF